MISDFIESILNIFSGNFIYFIGGLEVIKGNISIGQLLTFNTLYGLFLLPKSIAYPPRTVSII